jgi:hypothetical protein
MINLNPNDGLSGVKTAETVSPTNTAVSKMQGRQITLTQDNQSDSRLSLMGKLVAGTIAFFSMGAIAYTAYSNREIQCFPLIEENSTKVPSGEIDGFSPIFNDSVTPKEINREIHCFTSIGENSTEASSDVINGFSPIFNDSFTPKEINREIHYFTSIGENSTEASSDVINGFSPIFNESLKSKEINESFDTSLDPALANFVETYLREHLIQERPVTHKAVVNRGIRGKKTVIRLKNNAIKKPVIKEITGSSVHPVKEIKASHKIWPTFIESHLENYGKTTIQASPIAPKLQEPAVQQGTCVDPKAILNERFQSGEFKGITKKEMEEKFGLEPRSMTISETREFYNVIAEANREFGNKVIQKFGKNSNEAYQAALASCETRHNSRVFTRTLGNYVAQKLAEFRDLLSSGSTTGLSCKELFKKYNNNTVTIIDKAASPNNDVNRFAENLDKGIMHAVSVAAADYF